MGTHSPSQTNFAFVGFSTDFRLSPNLEEKLKKKQP